MPCCVFPRKFPNRYLNQPTGERVPVVSYEQVCARTCVLQRRLTPSSPLVPALSAGHGAQRRRCARDELLGHAGLERGHQLYGVELDVSADLRLACITCRQRLQLRLRVSFFICCKRHCQVSGQKNMKHACLRPTRAGEREPQPFASADCSRESERRPAARCNQRRPPDSVFFAWYARLTMNHLSPSSRLLGPFIMKCDASLPTFSAS